MLYQFRNVQNNFVTKWICFSLWEFHHPDITGVLSLYHTRGTSVAVFTTNFHSQILDLRLHKADFYYVHLNVATATERNGDYFELVYGHYVRFLINVCIVGICWPRSVTSAAKLSFQVQNLSRDLMSDWLIRCYISVHVKLLYLIIVSYSSLLNHAAYHHQTSPDDLFREDKSLQPECPVNWFTHAVSNLIYISEHLLNHLRAATAAATVTHADARHW